MRTKWLLLMSIVAFGVAVCLYFWPAAPAKSMSGKLSDFVQRGPGTVIDFSEVAPFDWERVFFFHPYTPLQHIDACLGIRWSGASSTSVEWNEGVNLVVFVRDKTVVCWFDHSRAEGDLVGIADSNGYSREEANFRVCLSQDHRLVLVK